MRRLVVLLIGQLVRLATYYLVHPFAAHSKLILTCVHGETEALGAGLAPNASSSLAEALLAAMAFPAGPGAMLYRPHAAVGFADPAATGVLRPPLALSTLGAGLAAYIVCAVRTLTRLADQVRPMVGFQILFFAHFSLVHGSQVADAG